MNCANCRINLQWALQNLPVAGQEGEPVPPPAGAVARERASRFYRTAEERRQFWTGFLGWFGLNLALYPLYYLVFTDNTVWAFAVLALNVVALTVLGFKRKRMAMGALAAFGAALLLSLCATAACFVAFFSSYH